jgi:hypothetical protein
MSNQTPRDESLPRQSNIVHFLNEEEFDAIPADVLSAAADEGTAKHDLLEKTYAEHDCKNILARMFSDGLDKIFIDSDFLETPEFEEQLNGSRFTGKPDFVLDKTMVDYKFSNELRPSTALQLVMYGMLEHEVKGLSIDRFFAFHFPHDRALFIHKVPDATVPVLVEFANYIIDNHESIKGGALEKYEALNRWAVIQRDYDLFEYVGSVLPPMMITSPEDAIAAASIFVEMQKVTDYEKVLKREILRYMKETGDTKIGNDLGFGVTLAHRKVKVYDPAKKAAAKSIYDAALAGAVTDTLETTYIKRFSPRKKKAKQIN